ncbi:hypothetical protein NPIL_111361 [Nephila pilipes]|uniref:Uncharacterized protein n=1 Tax=Nephila pilipes TaxID=299642 RepID=A0A8X6U1Q4_NEPPI|nr:hypothetical protein NPIL_111361 [Nephila pilipes]
MTEVCEGFSFRSVEDDLTRRENQGTRNKSIALVQFFDTPVIYGYSQALRLDQRKSEFADHLKGLTTLRVDGVGWPHSCIATSELEGDPGVEVVSEEVTARPPFRRESIASSERTKEEFTKKDDPS